MAPQDVMGGSTVRTTLAAMALAVFGLTGCAGNRCTCCSSGPCLTPAPASYKPCLICNASNAAPAQTPVDHGSPYTSGAPAPQPPAKSPWPTVVVPVPTPLLSGAPATLSAPTPRPPSAAVVHGNEEHQPETPATELPEPSKLPDRPSDPVPQRPKLPEAPADVPPGAFNLGQTPEPEVAPILQTSATAEPKPIAPGPILARPAEGAKVLTGVVESWRTTRRLRYAAVDVEDPNGGRVTLIGSPVVDRLHEGQHIRVRGILIPTADRGSAPTFDVQAIDVLD